MLRFIFLMLIILGIIVSVTVGGYWKAQEPLIAAEADALERASVAMQQEEMLRLANEQQQIADQRALMMMQEQQAAALKAMAAYKAMETGQAVAVIMAIGLIVIIVVAIGKSKPRQQNYLPRQNTIRIIQHGRYSYQITDGQGSDWVDIRVPEQRQLLEYVSGEAIE